MRALLLLLLAGCSTPPSPPDAAVPDLAVVDLTPSCGRAVGEPCCFSPPNLVFCDPGLYCDGTRTCRAYDLATPPDMTRPPGTFGSYCDGGAQCLPDPNGWPVRCQHESDTDTWLCCRLRSVPDAGTTWECV